ncbi:MAG: hypothetical protein WCV73_03845 [Patescibacteria group bacterium]
MLTYKLLGSERQKQELSPFSRSTSFMKKILLLLVIPAFILGIAQIVLAAGVAVNPDKLNFDLAAGQEQTKSVVVENISDRPVLYNIYVDELADQIYLAPANFRLEVGQKRQVKVKANPRHKGLFATNLSIVVTDLDRRTFNVSTGVKVPITLQVGPAVGFVLPQVIGKISFLLIPLLSAVIIILGIMLKKKKHWWQAIISKFKKHG